MREYPKNGRAVRSQQTRKSVDDKEFDALTTLYPSQRLRLEHADDLSCRVMDLVTPIGKGQRGLIVSPPRAGKTTLLQSIARGILANHPDAVVVILLVDERPEEATDMRRGLTCEVLFSSFDKPASHHIEVAETLLKRAKKLVLEGKDVVILMDSITRLARAYNSSKAPSGKLLSGGMDADGLFLPKRFFGAARAIENGGSLTIIGTALVDTGSRLDDLVFEEFKGTGNMELHLSRKLMDKRVFPCVDIRQSGTRKEELLLSEKELVAVRLIRSQLSSLNVVDAMENLLGRMDRTRTNQELLNL